MSRDWLVWVCAVLYIFFYVPLIYLTTSSGLPALAVLPVSTFSCCLFAVLASLVGGWWRLLWSPDAATKAGFSASFANGLLILLVPLAYAVAGKAHVLATMTVMKAGSILVSIPALIAGAAAARRTKIAALLCVGAIVLASYGHSVWSWLHGKPWEGGALGSTGAVIAVGYLLAYTWRLFKMGKFKHSMGFFAAEHVPAPFWSLSILLAGFGAAWALDRFGANASFLDDIVLGFAQWSNWRMWVLGLCSQAVGLAGGWILVDRQVSAAAMTLNRSAALIAGSLLVLLQGTRFSLEQAGAAVVPVVLLLLRSERQRA